MSSKMGGKNPDVKRPSRTDEKPSKRGSLMSNRLAAALHRLVLRESGGVLIHKIQEGVAAEYVR